MGGLTFQRPRPLRDGDDLTGFCSGLEIVDTYAHERAPHAKEHGTAVVYVSYCGDVVAGIYSLSAHSVRRGDARGWLGRNATDPVPAVLLGILGVDKRFQGMGLGKSLLHDAVERSFNIRDMLGAKALLVDPANESARDFYTKCGFRPLETGRMFFPLR